MRTQAGYIKRAHGTKKHPSGPWIGRWYQDELQADGTVKRVQKSRTLCDYDPDLHRSEKDVKKYVRPLLDEILAPLNSGKVDVRSSMSLAQFVEQDWLPRCPAGIATGHRAGIPGHVAAAYQAIYRGHVVA